MPVLNLMLPTRLDGQSLRGVIRQFLDGCPDNSIPDEVCLDFQRLSFIKPAGVTFLSNFISWLHFKEVDVTFSGHERNAEAIRFLDDSLFFEQHLGDKLNPNARPRPTTRPLVMINHDHSHAWVRHNFVPWLAAALNLSNASLHPLQVCISELFNNIQDHSSRDIGSAFAQHFPNEQLVRISIADFGRGIPRLVRDLHPDLSDNEAIKK